MISYKNKETDSTRKEYYEYLNAVYEEIAEFLREKDGAMNPHKLEMMFEKTASPFVYWNEARATNSLKQGMSDDTRTDLMKKLTEKYHLKQSGDKYIITQRLETEDFRRLSENMRIAGFRYESKDRAFVRDVK